MSNDSHLPPAETDPCKMTNEELDAELRENGIDPHELDVNMLARIRAEKAAGKSGPLLDEAERQFEQAVAAKSTHERVAEQLAGELGEAVVIIQGFLMSPAMTMDQRKEMIGDARKFITKLGL